MRTVPTLTNRRRFLKTTVAAAAALPVAGLIPVQAVSAADMPKVSPDDPTTAKALNYVEQSAKDGQTCNNCVLWQGADAEWGGCSIFPGKSVSAKGWCQSWVKRG